MQITTESTDAGNIVMLEGEISIYYAAQLKESLLAALENFEMLEINLENVSEIDTSGVQILAALLSTAGNQGKLARITACSQPVQDVIQLCNLGPEFGLDLH